MILRNENQGYEPVCGQKMSAFEAIASVQKNDLLPCWFVTQPDHAHLSGMIAAGFDRQRFPELTADVVEAIGLHDEGWEIFDGSAPDPRPQAFQDGRAIPFIAMPQDQFLCAWGRSIGKAEQVSALAGVVVSRHFQSLGRFGLAKLEAEASECSKVRQFLSDEQGRERRLLSQCGIGPELIERLIAMLQFCDLLSLHICSNAPQPVEFPQDFGCGRISLHRQESDVVLSPTPLASPMRLSFPAFLAGVDHRVLVSRLVDVRLS
jgi:Protein of unknown function (DUF3891)